MIARARISYMGFAPLLMLLSSLAFSFEPLILAVAGGSSAPFLFNAAIKAGYMAAYIPLGLLFYRRALLDGRFWLMAWERRSISHSLVSIGNNFFRVCYAAAARFIDVSVVSVALGAYPALCAALLAWLFRRSDRYAAISIWRRTFFGLGFVGFALVAFAETGGFSLAFGSAARLALGFGLSALGAGLLALSAFQLRWGALFGADAARALGLRRLDAEFLGVSAIAAMGNLMALLIFCGLALWTGEAMSGGAFWFAFGGGALLAAFGEIPWRLANLRARDVGVNALAYVSPLFGLAWLYLAGAADVARFDWLALGAALIFACNALVAARGRAG